MTGLAAALAVLAPLSLGLLPRPPCLLTLLRDDIRQAGLPGHEPPACSTCTKGSTTKQHQRVTSDRCAVVTIGANRPGGGGWNSRAGTVWPDLRHHPRQIPG